MSLNPSTIQDTLSNHPKKVMLSAGEASGDMHAATLVKQLKLLDNTITFSGMGSHHLKNEGVPLIVDSSNIAVIGLVEILSHWHDIKSALNTMREAIIQQRPDLLILIDYKEFNFKLAKTAKEHGIKVLFYISPQVWAWRPKRVKKYGEVIDMMAVIFPFEVAFYEKENIPVRFVGHPLVNKVKPLLTKTEAIETFHLDINKKTIGLLPGSRKSEIERILPVMLETAKIIIAQTEAIADIKGIQFLLPIASTLDKHYIESFIKSSGLDIQLVENQFYDVVNNCDSVITASGTATLEIALIGTPMAIIYKLSPISYFIMRRLITVAHIGLANIVMGKRIVPEFIQNEATAENIAKEIVWQLTDKEYHQKIKNYLALVKEKLGEDNSSEKVAQLASEMLSNKV